MNYLIQSYIPEQVPESGSSKHGTGMWDLRGWFSSGIRIHNTQTFENIFPEQYASHDDKEFQIEHWYKQPAFHKKRNKSVFLGPSSVCSAQVHSSNVDGRLQLYPLAESGTCEQRSISSLNSEAMFGKFQDLDQNGFSVLRADDIPSAPMTMVCIFAYTLNPQGGFAMNTCQNHLVEHFHKVTKRNDYLIAAQV